MRGVSSTVFCCGTQVSGQEGLAALRLSHEPLRKWDARREQQWLGRRAGRLQRVRQFTFLRVRTGRCEALPVRKAGRSAIFHKHNNGPAASGPAAQDSMDPQILIDGHVHLHTGLQPDRVLDTAAANFAAVSGGAPWRGMLWLLELRGSTTFERLWSGTRSGPAAFGAWRMSRPANETVSLRAEHSASRARIDIVAGCQVVTAERLEVCLVGTRQLPAEGGGLEETLERALALDALTFLPWGAGKWTGERGRAVERVLLQDAGFRDRLFAADNGGRPSFWRSPALFANLEARGRRVLSGSDPLPQTGDERRIGSFGFAVETALDDANPAAVLLRALQTGLPVRRFGGALSPRDFVVSQLALRLRPRKV